MNRPEALIIHHSGVGGLADQFYAINEYHKAHFAMKSELGWWITYHWVISKMGKMTRTRKDEEEGAHAIGWNLKSIGVCLEGDFNYELPTNAQLEKVRHLRHLYNLPLKFHKEVQQYRTCPGRITHQLFEAPIILTPTDEEQNKAKEIQAKISMLAELVARLKLSVSLLLKK